MSETNLSKVNVILAESHEIIRLGVRTLLGNHPSLSLVAETEWIDELFTLAVKHKPDVILLDLALDGTSSVEHIPNLLLNCPQSRILAYSGNHGEQEHVQVLRAGASGIVAKKSNGELLVKALLAVAKGQVWFDRQLSKLLWQSNLNLPIVCYDGDSDKLLLSKLTERELSVARLASQGLAAKKIGEELSITEKTVRNKLTLIYEKLGVDGQVELCLKASDLGF